MLRTIVELRIVNIKGARILAETLEALIERGQNPALESKWERGMQTRRTAESQIRRMNGMRWMLSAMRSIDHRKGDAARVWTRGLRLETSSPLTMSGCRGTLVNLPQKSKSSGGGTTEPCIQRT
ncbi:hypothetical protein C8034_v001723 [Colletotrichum sidae]|uniref:Uncharacterized protein n=1 Tax=Colletotrichum sidae TaxID=1347389 RepID=A0A4R8TNV5_9PEZI|nr:hypothetical protein C8034_v001723 [Colletotrichum sidae]